MKKLNNEIWQKWAIIKNKNISYDIKNIIYGKYGLVIELYGVDDFVAQDISIKFGYPIAYRLIDHDYNEVKYQKLIQNGDFHCEWHSYIIKNSQWVDQLTQEGNIVIENKKKYVHYAITEEDYVIEVVSTKKPEIEIIKNS